MEVTGVFCLLSSSCSVWRTCGSSAYPPGPSFREGGGGSGPATLSSMLSKQDKIHLSPHPETQLCFYTKAWDFIHYLFVLHLFLL